MKLLIFTQKVDRNDSVLGFFHTWIAEFAIKADEVIVICLEKGEYDLPSNVTVYSLGKESNPRASLGIFRGLLDRVKYAINLYHYLFIIRDSYDKVFVHMNPIYLVLCGWYWKITGVKSYLWYVHKKIDLKLIVSVLFADKVFTSSKESMRVPTNRVLYVGHGIDTNNFKYSSHLHKKNELNLVHIGRLTKIKNIEVLIDCLYLLRQNNVNAFLYFFGDASTKEDYLYKESIKEFIEKKGLKDHVYFKGSIVYNDLSNTLENMHISVNMTPTGGMDKSVL